MTLAQELQPIDWVTVDKALRDWASDKLGGINVQWAEQNLDQPEYPYVSMKRDAFIKPGYTDEIRTSFDAAQVGEEIEFATVGPREFTLNIQAHVDEESGSNDVSCNAVALLGKLQASLSQRSVMYALSEADLAVIEELGVLDISLVVNGKYINRASMDVRFRTTSVMTERVGYIDKVEIKVTDPLLSQGDHDLVIDAS